MPLPAAARRRVPEQVRDNTRLRALAVGLGVIPPRSMHHPAEAALLGRLAGTARRAVEIGVYEGASGAVLARALPPGGELHLVDPFGLQSSALRPGQRGTAWASRLVVARAARRRNVRCVWHRTYSHDLGPRWSLPIDLLFIDGDHSEEAVRRDWDLFSPYVRPGGHVAFHDARADVEGAGWPGPTAVVMTLFGTGGSEHRRWRVVAEQHRTVVVRKSSGETGTASSRGPGPDDE
jgi:predicted O-methyltransferase YrrM